MLYWHEVVKDIWEASYLHESNEWISYNIIWMLITYFGIISKRVWNEILVLSRIDSGLMLEEIDIWYLSCRFQLSFKVGIIILVEYLTFTMMARDIRKNIFQVIFHTLFMKKVLIILLHPHKTSIKTRS